MSTTMRAAFQKTVSGRNLRNLVGVATSNGSSSRFASTLVIAEHDSEKLHPSTFNTLTASRQLNGDVSILVAGPTCSPVVDEVKKIANLKRIIVAENGDFTGFPSEKLTPTVHAVHNQFKFSHILAPSSAVSRGLIPRLAAKLNSSPISDVIGIEGEDCFTRNIYAGNALMKLKSLDDVKLVTIRPTGFDPETPGDSAQSTEVVQGDASTTDGASDKVKFVETMLSKSDRPELASASIVISGGRGMKSGEHFDLLYTLADKLGGAVGASRAAVDAGMVPNDMQIGQTGKIVAPELYVAVGISGAIQHLAGMKDSKVIVAINKDEEAPIFQVSDYGLVADLFKAVPDLTEKI